MPAEEFFSETFQDLLATFLDGAYSERLAHLAENVRKAGNLVDEVRNPVSPALITQMLLSLVQGIGGAAIVPVLQKRIRDEVSFGKGLIPWRRSPVWLVLRVAMQRQLQLLHGGELGYVAYKILLCTVLSRLLDECVDHGMSPWHVSLLQKKLGRKMAKLETRCFRDGGQGHQDLMIQSLLQDTAPTFKQSIENAAKHLEAVLLHFKSQSLRKIPRLPLRASKEDQFLSLPSSRENLKRRLFSAMHQDGLFSKRLELAGSKEFDVNLNGHPAVENAQKHFRKLSDLTKIIDTSVSDATALQAQIAASLDGEDITSLRCKVTAKIESLMCDVEPKTPSNMRFRNATLAWTVTLRQEVMASTSDVTSKQASLYAFRAALLCRKTFSFMAKYGDVRIAAADLKTFVRASIALQQNLTVTVESMGEESLRLFKSDTIMCHELASTIRQAIKAHEYSVTEAVLDSIGLPSAAANETQPMATLDNWTHLKGESDGWISSTLRRKHPDPSQGTLPQHISFHITQGHLLIDGKTIGKLPDNIRENADVKAIFGSRHFLVYTSEMPGMSYRIATLIEEHMIHFGFRGKEVIVVSARKTGEVYEYVPSRVFVDGNNIYDLPRGLVDNCFHWLDKKLGQLEIRRDKSPWKQQTNGWTLNIHSLQVHRPGQVLVNPSSKTAALLRPIFEGFDDTQQMTIFQPIRSQDTLNVEFRHLELSFFVNENGALQCRELGAVVDSNQDAGTLYGYGSMIVLHDASDPQRRCLIAPLAELVWKPSNAHISVMAKIDTSAPRYARISEQGRAYARFDIDTTLGRLTCPPEPRLLFTKVQLHAFTSFPLPDPLTGRTGEEEACHTMLSGRLQPWVSLPNVCFGILGQMEMLVPKREYYPSNLKALQKVEWSKHLPAGLQNDRYIRILRDLVAKSDQLRPFEGREKSSDKGFAEFYEHWASRSDSHLHIRGEIQRARFECPSDEIEKNFPVQRQDTVYVSRGWTQEISCDVQQDSDCKASAIFQVVRMLRDKPRSLPMSRDMWTILQEWKRFGGFSDSVYMELQPISLLLDPHTVRDQWGDLVQICALSDAEETHLIMFTLAGLAFAPGANMDVIHLLAAYCYLPELRSIERPVELSYSDFIYNKELTAPTLKSLIRSYYVDFVASDIEAVGQDEINAAIEAQRLQHNAACAQECSRLVDVLMEQWPDHRIPPTRGFTSAYIHVQNAVKEIKALWQCLYDNLLLSNYIEEVEEAVLFIRTYPKQVSNTSSDDNQPNNAAPILVLQQRKFPTLLEIAPRILCPHFVPLPENVRLLHQKPLERPSSAVYEQPKEYAELKGIIASFDASDELLRRSYGQDLASSLRALEASSEQNSRSSGQVKANPISMSELQTAITNSEKHILATFQRIKSCFSVWPVSGKKQQHASGYNWLQAAGLWPRLTPVSILELLQSRNKSRLEEDVFKSLLQYGEALTFHQRLLRLFRALMKRDERRIQEELANDGHSNWKTTDYPDWLLMEIDSNMLIRDEQVTVATAMISPASGGNAVYQLNMGKGKTSMIVPMVMCVIADGQHLARLGVPKALLLPTAQVLQSRLGGLVGREVRHVAFSRRLLTQDSCRGTFSTFKHHHQQLTENRGIFIAAPEHMLAFKLSCEQGYVDGKDVELAVEMMQFHQYLRTHLCRDVLDESDFTLAVRTQLVYPSGTFTEVDGTPYRWELLQTLLSLVEGHVTSLATSHPHWINVVKRPHGGFPLIYILQSAIEDVIRELIVRDIVQGRVSFFRPSPSKLMSTRGDLGEKSLSTAEMQKLLELAMQDTTSDAAIDAAAAMFADTDAAANGLLLLRGLLHHNILLTCLKKRWNVQYGLHPQRWPIAVPYEARGVPSERSEFGHPDVTIIFTCLAFYYAGVNLEQFRQGLGHVLHHMDDPATEYEKWSAGDGTVALPEDLQHWNTVNVDDEGQMMRLWSCLRYARSVVNHYLNTFVFPLYCRQFSVKLEASAWDLPIFNQPIAGQGTPTMSNARTTGFSGTNDNKSMLPLTIKQYDLPGLQQTNAEVLTYLLQPRNRGYICTGGHGSTRWSEQELVKSLASSGIQIFIDAGAYILEKKNEDLARAWLAMAGPKIKAAVYFDEKDNRAWVVFRDETPAKAPLVSTPYIDRLEECIVYYDEAHTRGVDLQLPADAKGALTLALGQTKDHTVQAAMRLRQLQTTQSVVFYAPPEVDQSIRELCGLGDSVSNVFVNSANVVRWLLEQTCLANEQLGSLYASHGASFCRRTAALWKSQDTLKDVKTRHSLLSVLEQPERQSLKVMYGYSNAKSTTGSRQEKESRDKKKGLTGQLQEPCLKVFMNQLQKYNATGASSLGMRKGTFEEVEQEREVEVQVEQQRKTVRRKDIKALKFPGRVAAAIWNFVKTGFLIGGTGYETMFQYLAKTDIGCRYGVKALETRLFVSSEFQRTIESPGSGTSPADDFLRPVEWLIWSPASETGLVIIPEEFELLIHEIRRSRYVHLIAYAAPVTKNMLAFSSLRYYSFPALPENYTMPTWLPIEMGILAGRLYMDFDEAMYMAQYIGQPQESELDGVRGITPAKEFCSNTTTFLLEWLPLRRTAQEALHTTAAYVCQGRPLRPDHRFFSQSLRYSKLEEAGLVKAEDVTDQLGFGRLRIEDDNVKIKKEQTEP
ncbi:hypothetical protein SEPCBS119000_006234 [Sporothrix epigloea]|uniref:ubiquitinyl hydrolase 1 n=1 Tax=Sporothrix epigloea TaxID=1892477 RepID=A0ABP0E539_9PEZI